MTISIIDIFIGAGLFTVLYLAWALFWPKRK